MLGSGTAPPEWGGPEDSRRAASLRAAGEWASCYVSLGGIVLRPPQPSLHACIGARWGPR